MNLILGMAFELTKLDEEDGLPWDFNITAKRNKARAIVQRERPLLLIGSPMCAAFSHLQRTNFAKLNKEQSDKIMQHGRKHLEFSMELYKEEQTHGLYFLHEHPATASSWNEKSVLEVLRL